MQTLKVRLAVALVAVRSGVDAHGFSRQALGLERKRLRGTSPEPGADILSRVPSLDPGPNLEPEPLYH